MQDNRELGKAEALRRAMLAMIDKGRCCHGPPDKLGHPLSWLVRGPQSAEPDYLSYRFTQFC